MKTEADKLDFRALQLKSRRGRYVKLGDVRKRWPWFDKILEGMPWDLKVEVFKNENGDIVVRLPPLEVGKRY